jgi:membrane protease subunit HflC
LGLDVVDVRLKQTNLPSQNLEATFDRMRAEREREAADERARGNEAAQRVRALADRTVVETLSVADREANVIRGEADAERNRIFAEAYGADPEFFAFYRSLQAYETALSGDNSTMVMTPDSQFFNYFKSEVASGDPLLAPALPSPSAAALAPEAPVLETAEDPAPETPDAADLAPVPADPAPAPEAPEADTAPANN